MRRSIVALAGCWLAAVTIMADAAPAMQPFEADSLSRIVADRKGKPFVLVVWALNCAYCQASLKTLAQESRKRKNLNVVTISTDPLEDKQAAVLMQKKLAAVGMTGNAWAFGTTSPERLRYAIDPKWHGEIPRSYWFGANGVAVAYSGVITSELIEKMSADFR